MAIKLAALKGTKERSDVTIDSVPFAIGRCRSANFIIAHMNVSRNHCQIVVDNKLWKVSDHSSSGTFLNGLLVGKGRTKVLSDGDVIRFGPAESNLCWTFSLSDCVHKEETSQPHGKGFIQVGSNSPCFGVKNSRDDSSDDAKPRENTESKSGTSSDKICEEKDLKESALEIKSKSESESGKVQELLQELEQARDALNNLEEKNTALQGKLASRESNKIKSGGSKLIENLTELMETELQCTICSELFVTAVTLSCTHTFCKYCIDQWKKKQKTCPICRKRISNETRSIVMDNYIDKMVGNLSVELKERREAIIKDRTAPQPVKKRRSHR